MLAAFNIVTIKWPTSVFARFFFFLPQNMFWKERGGDFVLQKSFLAQNNLDYFSKVTTFWKNFSVNII